MDQPLIVISLLCFVGAIGLFMAEVMIPSGGLLGMMAACATLAGIVTLFAINTTLGLVGAIVCVAATPVLFMVSIKFWPHTPVARWLSLGALDETIEIEEARTERNALLGQQGTAQTDLHPVGFCLLNGQREECLAASGVIEAGTLIQVVCVDGKQIKVCPVDEI